MHAADCVVRRLPMPICDLPTPGQARAFLAPRVLFSPPAPLAAPGAARGSPRAAMPRYAPPPRLATHGRSLPAGVFQPAGAPAAPGAARGSPRLPAPRIAAGRRRRRAAPPLRTDRPLDHVVRPGGHVPPPCGAAAPNRPGQDSPPFLRAESYRNRAMRFRSPPNRPPAAVRFRGPDPRPVSVRGRPLTTARVSSTRAARPGSRSPSWRRRRRSRPATSPEGHVTLDEDDR